MSGSQHPCQELCLSPHCTVDRQTAGACYLLTQLCQREILSQGHKAGRDTAGHQTSFSSLQVSAHAHTCTQIQPHRIPLETLDTCSVISPLEPVASYTEAAFRPCTDLSRHTLIHLTVWGPASICLSVLGHMAGSGWAFEDCQNQRRCSRAWLPSRPALPYLHIHDVVVDPQLIRLQHLQKSLHGLTGGEEL